MRVLIIPSFYPTADEPNRGIFFQTQAEQCVREDIEIHVLYYELRSLKKLMSVKCWRNHFQVTYSWEKNLMVYRCRAWNLIPTHFKLGGDIWVRASFILFKRYVKLFGCPDIIHVQSAFLAARLVLKILNEYNITYFINEHSTSVKLSKFTPTERQLYKKGFDKAYCVVAVSEPFKNLISEKFAVKKEHIRVIPNFINTEFFKPLKQISGKQEFTFLTVCFLEQKKRLDRLISSFYKAFDGDKNVKLIIGGEGPQKEVISELISQYELQSSVILLGSLTQEQVKSNMQQCDCFVLASEVETFGVVLIEAMSLGKPVIATRSGGPEGFIIPQVGILADNDADSITNALVTMKDNSENFDANTIRNYVFQNFSANAVSGKIIDLYHEIDNSDKISK